MIKEKEDQLAFVKSTFAELVDKKFRKGDEEHGENIMNLDLVGEAVMEIIDACVYLILELKKRMPPSEECPSCTAKDGYLPDDPGPTHIPSCPKYIPF